MLLYVVTLSSGVTHRTAGPFSSCFFGPTLLDGDCLYLAFSFIEKGSAPR